MEERSRRADRGLAGGLRCTGAAGGVGLRVPAPHYRGNGGEPSDPELTSITPTCCMAAQNVRCRKSSLIWMPTAVL